MTGNTLHGFGPIMARLRRVDGTRNLSPAEMEAIGMDPGPSMRDGQLTAQRRAKTAHDALRELDRAELVEVLAGLASIKGPIWAASVMEAAIAKIEQGRKR